MKKLLLIMMLAAPFSSFAKTVAAANTPTINATGLTKAGTNANPSAGKYISPDGKYCCSIPWRGIWCDGSVSPN